MRPNTDHSIVNPEHFFDHASVQPCANVQEIVGCTSYVWGLGREPADCSGLMDLEGACDKLDEQKHFPCRRDHGEIREWRPCGHQEEEMASRIEEATKK